MGLRLSREEFDALVEQAVANLPRVFREKLPKEARKVSFSKKPPVEVGPGAAVLAADAKSGTLVSGAIRGKKPLLPDLVGLDGPLGSILGDPDVLAAISVSPKGDRISLKKVPLGAFGAYLATFGAASGTSGTISGSLSFKPPKPAVKKFEE